MRTAFLALVFAFSAAAASAGPGVVEIADPSAFSQVLAVSDVHGMYDELLGLLQGAKVTDGDGKWAGGKTLLIVVGDSIDKGPKSIEVLDLWMSLGVQARSAGGAVIHLLGNHEAEFLANPNDDSKAKELLSELKKKGLSVDDLTDPKKPRGAFLRSMPAAARVGRWLFCHAGLYPEMAWADFAKSAASAGYGDALLAGEDSILEAKDWWKDKAARKALQARLSDNGFFGMVQGHQPKAYKIIDRIGAVQGGRFVKIDNGMAPEAGSNPGHILRFPKAASLLQDAMPVMESVDSSGAAELVTPQAL